MGISISECSNVILATLFHAFFQQLEYCKLLYSTLFQLNQILMEYDEITRQVYNGRNASYPDLSRKISALMSFFENCFQSHRKWLQLLPIHSF